MKLCSVSRGICISDLRGWFWLPVTNLFHVLSLATIVGEIPAGIFAPRVIENSHEGMLFPKDVAASICPHHVDGRAV